MTRILSILFLMLSVNTLFAEGIDSVSVQDKDSTNSVVIKDSANFVNASLMYMERDKSNYVTYYGHIALRLSCPTGGLDYVFTYQSDDIKGFYEMITGSGTVALVPIPYKDFLKMYNAEARDVYEYPLHLTLTEKQDLWKLVDEYVAKRSYLPNDYLNSGCAQETASLILSVIKGQIKYGDYVNKIGTNQYAITKRLTDEGSWFRLFLAMFSSEECTRDLTQAERLFIPYDMVEAWKEVKIVDDNGKERNIFKTNTPIIYKTTLAKHEPMRGINTIVFFSIILAFVLIICVLQFVSSKASKLMAITDRVLLIVVTIMAILLMVVYCVANIPAANGLCHSFFVFNLVPLIVCLIDCKRKFSNKTWSAIYIVYSIVLIAQFVYMILNSEVVVATEYVIYTTLLIYTITKMILNKIKINV